ARSATESRERLVSLISPPQSSNSDHKKDKYKGMSAKYVSNVQPHRYVASGRAGGSIVFFKSWGFPSNNWNSIRRDASAASSGSSSNTSNMRYRETLESMRCDSWLNTA